MFMKENVIGDYGTNESVYWEKTLRLEIEPTLARLYFRLVK